MAIVPSSRPTNTPRHLARTCNSRGFTGIRYSIGLVDLYTDTHRIVLLLSQISYVYHLFARHGTLVTAAANIAPHFIINNLCLFIWILLWTRNYFWAAEII